MSFHLWQMKWYRKWKGGDWYRVIAYPFPEVDFWKPEEPVGIEIVVDREVWDQGINIVSLVKRL